MNRLGNAGFLELTAGWTGSAGLTLTADETVRGSPGRCALVATGTASGAGVLTVEPATVSRPSVTPGEVVEVSAALLARVGGAETTPGARLVFRAAGGGTVSTVDVSLTPPALAQHGFGRGGLRETYHRAWARTTVPATAATAALEIRATAASAGQAIEIVTVKPFLDAVPAGVTRPLPWDPGVHADDDLDLPSWPQTLRPFQAQAGAEPQTASESFGEGPARPQQRPTAVDPARRLNGRIRCDAVERETLEAFWRAQRGDFWFVEPDSDRLCVASFASDGAPRSVESRGPTVIMDVGLWLETA